MAFALVVYDFMRKLIDRGYATVITPGALHRGRLFHLQYKPLYEAIGEPNNRNRRPATMGRMVERLMLLDAVLADCRYTWLGTEQDKVAYFKSTFEQRGVGADPCLPHLVFGAGTGKIIRYFPDKLPIGVERDYGRRHVFLYLVTSEVPAAFRMFLFRHADLLGTMHQWTIRVIVPRRFKKAIALYRYAVSSLRRASGLATACGKWTRQWRCGASGRPSCATSSHAAKDASSSWSCRINTCASPLWSAWHNVLAR